MFYCGISEIEKGELLSVAEEVEKIGGELKGIENKVTPILLAPLLKEIIKGEQLKHSRSKHLKINLSLPKMAFSSLVTISRIDLKRIIANLISNSIDAMKGQNEARIEISLEKNCDDILQIVVKDNGHGMTKEQVENIGKRGLSYKKNGNGLGMNFIMEKVHDWHGELKIHSEVSNGTSIRSLFPLIVK